MGSHPSYIGSLRFQVDLMSHSGFDRVNYKPMFLSFETRSRSRVIGKVNLPSQAELSFITMYYLLIVLKHPKET
jgi:hypothetical protein